MEYNKTEKDTHELNIRRKKSRATTISGRSLPTTQSCSFALIWFVHAHFVMTIDNKATEKQLQTPPPVGVVHKSKGAFDHDDDDGDGDIRLE